MCVGQCSMAQIASDSVMQSSVNMDSSREIIHAKHKEILKIVDVDSTKHNFRKKLKSIFSNRPSVNDSIRGKLKKMSKPKKITSDSLAGNIKQKLTEKKSTISITPTLKGSVISESYATNYLDPYSKSETMYSRIYGSPSVEILKLPFNLNFYYTTEDNSFYNSNYITLDFDLEQYRRNLRESMEKKIKDQVEEKAAQSQNLLDASKSEQLLKKKIAEEKAKLSSLEDLNSQFDVEKLKSTDYLEQARQKALSKLDTTGLSEKAKQRLKDSAFAQIDTAKYIHLQDSMTDSLNNSIDMDRHQVVKDSIEKVKQDIAKYEDQWKTANELLGKYKAADKYAQDSLIALKNQYASKEFIKSKTSEHPRLSKALSIVSKVEQFKIGLTHPTFSKYTLNGIPVKGLDLGLDLPQNKLQIAVGRTFRSEYNTFGLSQPQPVFDRNVVGIKSTLPFGKKKNKSIGLSSVSFFDAKTVERPKQNILHSLEYKTKMGPKMSLGLAINHSILIEENTDDAEISFDDGDVLNTSALQDVLDHFSFETEWEYKIHKSVTLKTIYQRVNPEYISLGNPFLRTNYHELDIKMKSRLFKRKITLTSFYKKFEDNITHIGESTNQMSGYGVTIRSNFKKALNFQLQHSPYQQGNNSPDTLFRTDNQMEVTSASIIYNKQFKTSTLISILTYVNSTVDYNNGQLLVDNSMYMNSTTWSSKKVSFTGSLSRNITGPVVDTLNFWGVRLGVNQTSGKKVNFSLNSFYDQFDEGAVRHRSILQARFNLLPKLETALNGEYGRIEGLYGIESKDVFGCRVLLKYVL